MTITYRNLKGAPLSADELDQNFRELHERLEYLERSEGGNRNEGLARITQEGVDLVFESETGDLLGRFTLPSLQFRPRGAWISETDYLFYDLCLFEGKTYFCKTPHKSSKSFEHDLKKWEIIFSAE